MREILFRGKQRDMLNWVEGTGIFSDGINTWISANEPNRPIAYGLKHKIVLPKTVGQFTGLNDKNGKKIFEGDICKVGNLTYKVVFEYSSWWFEILPNKVYCCPAFNSHCGELCEIIGNIHDNPELLENP